MATKDFFDTFKAYFQAKNIDMSYKHFFFLLLATSLFFTCNNDDESATGNSKPFIRCLVDGEFKEFSNDLGGRGTNIDANASIWSSPTFDLRASVTFNFKDADEVTNQQIEDLEGQQFGFNFDDPVSAFFDIEIDNNTYFSYEDINNAGEHYLEVTNVYEDPQQFDPNTVYRVEGNIKCKVSLSSGSSTIHDITEGEFSLLFTGGN